MQLYSLGSKITNLMHKMKERDVQLQASIYAAFARSAGSHQEKIELYSHVISCFEDCDEKHLLLKHQHQIEVCNRTQLKWLIVVNYSSRLRFGWHKLDHRRASSVECWEKFWIFLIFTQKIQSKYLWMTLRHSLATSKCWTLVYAPMDWKVVRNINVFRTLTFSTRLDC